MIRALYYKDFRIEEWLSLWFICLSDGNNIAQTSKIDLKYWIRDSAFLENYRIDEDFLQFLKLHGLPAEFITFKKHTKN